MNRQQYRENLRTLSLGNLAAECHCVIANYRSMDPGPARWHAINHAGLVWDECLRRCQEQVYRDAYAAVRAEEEARRVSARRAIDEVALRQREE